MAEHRYAAFAKGDFAVLNDLFAKDLLRHEPGRSRLAGDYSGREAVYGRRRRAPSWRWHRSSAMNAGAGGGHPVAVAASAASARSRTWARGSRAA